MPSAGAVIPPTITAARQPISGKPLNYIDTATYIELDTGKKNLLWNLYCSLRPGRVNLCLILFINLKQYL